MSNLEALYRYFYKINREAYKNVWLLPNQVLSKNLEWGDALNRYHLNRGTNMSFMRVIFLIVYSFLRNIYALLCFVLKKICFGLVRPSSPHCGNPVEETVIIDSYFLINRIIKNGKFLDHYLPGLSSTLKKNGIRFVYAPKFFGPENPFNFYRAVRVLKREAVPMVTEFQCIKGKDLAKLILFALVYPFLILATAKKIADTSEEAGTLKYALYCSLKSSGIIGYVRYLYGRRLALGFQGNLKCISWFENQALDKCFYKGLRTGNKGVRIYGAQLLVKPSGLLNLTPDEREVQFGVVPDVIVTNGPYYIPEKSPLNYRVGPALRYRHVFQKKPNPNPGGSILLLLPYYVSEADRILRLVKEIALPPDRKVLVKFHPTTDVGLFEKYSPFFTFTEENIYSLFEQTALVIGSETGSLVEAVAQGIPVIHLESPDGFTYNPMPGIGQGIVWDNARSRGEVKRLIRDFLHIVRQQKETIVKMAMEYRRQLFSRVSEENIIRVFDL